MQCIKKKIFILGQLNSGLILSSFIDKLPRKTSTIEISKQLVRSVTSISANLAEGSSGASKKEFTNFMNIALKSAIETEHWLNFLKKLDFDINNNLLQENLEIIKILTTIVKKSRNS